MVWEIALPSLMETRPREWGDLPSTSTSTLAPEGSFQACAINFLTIYSQVEFIFPEEPHMWCISGFRLWLEEGGADFGPNPLKWPLILFF